MIKARRDKSPQQKRLEQIAVHNSLLIDNAFDFFERAITECVMKDYKYATLHLATSVELFLKARLMKEHWSLIFANKSEIGFEQLISGNFQSVTIPEAIDRINSIFDASQHIPRIKRNEDKNDEKTPLDLLYDDRNRIVHFHTPRANIERTSRSALERQLRVWHFLHNLLSKKWSHIFGEYSERIIHLNKQMKSQNEFLRIKYEEMKSHFEAEIAKGKMLVSCPICDYKAIVVNDLNQISTITCDLCDETALMAVLQCPHCSNAIALDNGISSCTNCREYIDSWWFRKILTNSPNLVYSDPIYCRNCESYDVFKYKDNYICPDCFTLYMEQQIHQCVRCQQLYTGNEIENTWEYGCMYCKENEGDDEDESTIYENEST